MIDQVLQASLLAEYDSRAGLYRDLASTSSSVLTQMLEAAGVRLHSITHRSKTQRSLKGKLAKPEKEYAALSEITDLAGVRVTTYFAEDVDKVADIVEREFEIDRARSIDKRQILDPDRFGYQSLHYVASLSTVRCALIEYARFAGVKFELQVRSILQHAWAEIEHDLGYKSAAGVPRSIRRRFSRIAGLLELADDEFAAIRRELATYAAEVDQEIREQPTNVGIDSISLEALASSQRSNVRRLSMTVADAAGATLEPMTDWTRDSSAGILSALGITTIAELERLAEDHAGLVAEFARNWLDDRQYPTLHEGIGILYLAYVLVAEQRDPEGVRQFLVDSGFDPNHEGIDLVDRLLKAYSEARHNVAKQRSNDR